MTAPINTVLDNRMQEISFKLLILNGQIESLTSERDALVRELAKLEEARLGFINPGRGDSSGARPHANQTTSGVNGVVRTPSGRRAGVRAGSIKEAALKVLNANPDGLIALDILANINEGRDEPLTRTSLSPQLSRLGANGLIMQDGSLWKITHNGKVALRELSE